MKIETAGWVAQNDKMPGNARLRVYGTVTVAHPGVQPSLALRALQDKSFALALELTLQTQDGIYPQVVTDKAVAFEMPGDHSIIPKVDIFHDGKLLTSITDIIDTH
ncbi:hypothetical protein N5F23_10000 [Pseudomonas sichuanensis]|uniref:hypothetical protein n=1 Tax=Pseudomonas TaxID=286 RepID=UPI00129B431D|nr:MULTISPECIES: hypothetical protein [Pseudomonas]MDH0730769.1 hypothetical protein [Pseudomonas sichuanensis]MDH1582928.1 hypothetical protein [Pseudomonas sichuanensis]MDH1592244.1 hypothetical protein [Pseudomonas sichuanensis]MDH1600143.1 hypothetical protein [Pseudomonas sichuanensis]